MTFEYNGLVWFQTIGLKETAVSDQSAVYNTPGSEWPKRIYNGWNGRSSWGNPPFQSCNCRTYFLTPPLSLNSEIRGCARLLGEPLGLRGNNFNIQKTFDREMKHNLHQWGKIIDQLWNPWFYQLKIKVIVWKLPAWPKGSIISIINYVL